MRLGPKVGIALGALAAAALPAALAQAPGVKRTLLETVDVVGTEPKECVLGTAELAPGATTGKHLHHGIEVGMVLEGEGELAVEGEGTRRLGAGESFRIEAGRPHQARNTGAVPLKVVSTWVVEKGKPLAEAVR